MRTFPSSSWPSKNPVLGNAQNHKIKDLLNAKIIAIYFFLGGMKDRSVYEVQFNIASLKRF